MQENEDFTIQRIPLNTESWCGHALIHSAAISFNIAHVCQKDLHNYVSDPNWGTEKGELYKMARSFLPKDHILMKENWSKEDLDKLNEKARVVVILDTTDILKRVSNITGKIVNDVDGHYISYLGNGLIIDPSAEEIVVGPDTEPENKGVILTDCPNIYYLSDEILEKIWFDTNKNGSINKHLALVMLHPDDDPSILEEYRKK